MRTIKFRGRKSTNGLWTYGDLHIVTPCPHIHPAVGCKENIDPKTIGQFTGIFDKNGKEIYEGDFLSTPLSEVNPFGMVSWHPNGYFFIDTEFGKRMPAEDHRTLGEMMKYMIGGRSTEFEVVGNIHDDPEMAKGGAK